MAIRRTACGVGRAPAAGVVMLIALAFCPPTAAPQAMPLPGEAAVAAAPAPTLELAQRYFYNGDYDRAIAASRALCGPRPTDLPACELHTSSLHFQLKRAFDAAGGGRHKGTAWTLCAVCPDLLAEFRAAAQHGQALARATLAARPDDGDALFYLGKIDLNHVWLLSGTLGRKSGWSEYWEARRSLDRVLRLQPGHIRARIARAWIDYIVGTAVPRGTRWMLGGGNRRRGLLTVQEVVQRGDGGFFDQIEARFALWDMQVRERDLAGAMLTARGLADEFPGNRGLRTFLGSRDPAALVPESRPARTGDVGSPVGTKGRPQAGS